MPSFYRRFPNYYYSLSYNIPGGGVVQILMIDTVLLCGNTGDDFLHDQPHGPVDLDKADDQLAWITQSMKNSRYSRSHYSSSSCAFSVLTMSMNIKMTRNSMMFAAWNNFNSQHLVYWLFWYKYLWFDEIPCIYFNFYPSPVDWSVKLEFLLSCSLKSNELMRFI